MRLLWVKTIISAIYSDHEDTMYGTLGPERTVWDEEAHESTKKTIKKQKESKYI